MHERNGRDHTLKGLRVLVVEDSYVIACSVRKMLQDLGCQVVGPVGNVDDALSLVEAGSCDAAILDINLGHETSAAVAQRLEDLDAPFILVSGYASPPLKTFEFPAHRRLAKPLTTESLRTAMLDEFVSAR